MSTIRRQSVYKMWITFSCCQLTGVTTASACFKTKRYVILHVFILAAIKTGHRYVGGVDKIRQQLFGKLIQRQVFAGSFQKPQMLFLKRMTVGVFKITQQEEDPAMRANGIVRDVHL